jgi:hypothetical protein
MARDVSDEGEEKSGRKELNDWTLPGADEVSKFV